MGRKTVRVGIIGCGLMGNTHAETLRLLPNAEIGAACDLRIEAAESLVSDYAGPGAYTATDSAQLLADDSLDAVLICTWHDSHYPLAMAALASGKHIFIEKPLAFTVEECRAIKTAGQAAERHVVTGFFARFAPGVQQVRTAGLRPIATVAQMSSPRWADNFWAQDPRLGGGNVFSQGCHLLDLCCFLQGEEPIAVTAQGGTLTHQHGPIDTVAATMRFTSGAVASLFISDAGTNPHTGKVMIQLFCVEQVVAIHHLFGGERGQAVWWCPPDRVEPGINGALEWDTTGHRSLIRHFVNAVSGVGLPPGMPTAQDGLRVTALVEALFAAVRNQCQEIGVYS